MENVSRSNTINKRTALLLSQKKKLFLKEHIDRNPFFYKSKNSSTIFSKYSFKKTAGFSGSSSLTAPFPEFFEAYTKGNDSANYTCQNCQYN
ncbi:hypothetical protein TH62_08995 [Bacillus sp. TH008]|nr:hypothetical protein TH62_08995 [Bacillus sp. TH008]